MFHSAGALDDASIGTMTWDQVTTLLAAKVDGALLLDLPQLGFDRADALPGERHLRQLRDRRVVQAGARLDEDGVAGDRSLHTHAIRERPRDSRADLFVILVAKQAALAAMRVEPGHTN